VSQVGKLVGWVRNEGNFEKKEGKGWRAKGWRAKEEDIFHQRLSNKRRRERDRE
jgi:hypothetical protein